MKTANGSFGELMEEARKALDGMHCGFAAFKDSQRQLWKRWAGADMDAMLQTSAAAERFLQHTDKYRRLAALGILAFHWHAPRAMAATFEQISFDDTDHEVRGAALVALGICYAGTHDRRIEQLFAKTVRDERQAPEFRRIAYGNLFQVRGLTVDTWPPIGSSFRVPEDVDWEFVRDAERCR